MTAGRIDIDVDLSPASLASSLGKFGALALGAAGISASFGEVLKIGNDFTTTLNTMQAVSQATAQQMSAVSAKARELGNDISLPGTSASDAAAAMTELAKGGFSVQQSMDAAKGSLQLAAAAGVDAATAANIQAKALHAFGLEADQAAHVADVLANVANASLGDIGDFALGLQQSSAVAKNFGLSIEDTTAALGVLANAGIRGSDAGTLLKTSLLAITDQGKPAQRSIKELGLTLYDAQGNFVGLDSEFKQLGEAAKRMTPEMYQAATTTLFGSDAARIAGVAANDGAKKFEEMRAAVDRQGTAAEVANAKMQGLPGALERVKNASQDAALAVYGLIDGPLEKFANSAAKGITSATASISSGLKDVASGAGQSSAITGFVGGLGKLRDEGGQLLQVVKPLGEGLLAVVQNLGKSGGIVSTAGSAFHLLADGVGGALVALKPIADLVGGVLKVFADLPGPVQAAVAALIAFRLAQGPLLASTAGLRTAALDGATAMRSIVSASGGVANIAGVGSTQLGRFGSSIQQLGTHIPIIANMQQSFLNASAGATTFGRTMGTAASLGAGLRGAASGITSALGGPWVLGITAATVALTSWYSGVKNAERQTKAWRDAVHEISVAQTDLATILTTTNGSFTDTAIGNVTKQVDDLTRALQSNADKRSSFGQRIFTPNSAFDEDSSANANQAAVDALNKLKISHEQIARALSDNSAFSDLNAKLQAMGQGGKDAAAQLKLLRDDIVKTQQTATNTTPGFATLTAAVKVLSDTSSTASDRLNAMKQALDILAGKPVAVSDAMQKYNQVVRDTAAATREWDAAQGTGDQLLKNGAIDTATVNGDKLKTTLDGIRDATLTVATAGGDLGPVLQANEQQFADLSTATGLSVATIRDLAAQAGLVPKNIEILAALKGADGVEQQLVVIKGLLDKNAQGIDIPVDAVDKAALDKLREVGGKVDEVNGKPGIVHLSAPNQAALDAMQAIIDKDLPKKTQVIEVQYTGLGLGTLQRLHENIDNVPIAGNAVGGRLPTTGPGTGKTDGIVAVTANGTPVSMVDGGEWMINRRSSDKYDKELAMINAGTFPKLPGFAAGGRLAVDRALGQLEGESGKAYQYGGTGNPSWDCSGFISAAYALLKGLDWHQRWFTTESSFGALGFLPGSDPSGRGLSIGVHNGGGGQYSHMAATLAGTNIESGGNGVQVGAGAAGASDSQFENHFYLPGSAFSPPDDGTSTGSRSGRSRGGSKPWSQADELRLNSANISVQQAKEARDKALADPKKSQADKDQANTRVAQAEQRVRDLEAKKSSGQSDAGPSPQAPGLTSNLSDDQISMRDLQRSIDDANAKRNDTYADPQATADDKAKADDDLQKAMNALAAAQKKQAEGLNANATGAAGGSSVASASTISELLGNVAKSFVAGELQDAFKVVGIDDSGGAIGAAITQGIGYSQKVQAQTPQSFGADELAKQGPVTPGTPGWFDQLVKTLRIPAFIRDSGGPLPHGAAAFNFSGQEEWVLTGQQKQNYAKDMAALRSDALRPLGGDTTPHSVDASVTIENLHTGMTAGEFQTQWKMMQLEQRQRAGSFMARR